MPTRPASRGTAAKKGTRSAAKAAKRPSTTRAATKRTTTKRATTRTAAKRPPVRRTPAKAAPARKPTPDSPSRGITRVDQPSRRTHGYVVRLDYRKTPGGYRPQITRFFPDGRHGSRKAAWVAAEEFLVTASRRLRK